MLITTETENWITYPLCESARGFKPYKAYIDRNAAIRIVEDVIEPCCIYCLDGYPKYF